MAATDDEETDLGELIELVEVQRDAVKATLTGTWTNEERERDYRIRKRLIKAALQRLSIRDPFQWPDLLNAWSWGKQWPSYHERRVAVDEKIQPLIDRLESMVSAGAVDDWGGSPDSWASIEDRLAGLRAELETASTLDEFQDTGRRGREILIAVVNEMFEEGMVPEGQEPPKGSDAKARFDLIVDAYAPGKAHTELRRTMRAAWDLANHVTHSSGISRVDAFATAQATVLVVRTLAEMHSTDRAQ